MNDFLMEWHEGHPPHVGWWDGHKWSMPATKERTPVEAAIIAECPSFYQQGIYWAQDDDDQYLEPGICESCNGSGEGQFDDTTCYKCKGKGEV